MEIDRFISAAYLCISQSTPHLYVSALPFGAANYATIRDLQTHFPNTLFVTGGMNLWNVRCMRTIKAGGYVCSVAVSRDGRRIVSGSKDWTVRIWDAQTGVAFLEPLQGHSRVVTSVAISFDDQRIVSGSKDKTIRIWDAQTGAKVLEPLRGHSRAVTSVGFSSDGQRIVSGSSDRTIRIWDAQTGAPLLEPLQGHSYAITSVAFSADGQRIVSGSEDWTIRIWDSQTGDAHISTLR